MADPCLGLRRAVSGKRPRQAAALTQGSCVALTNGVATAHAERLIKVPGRPEDKRGPTVLCERTGENRGSMNHDDSDHIA